MLTPEEEKFLKYWSDDKNKTRNSFITFRRGLMIGMVFGIGILINFATGWYSRANMVANSQSTPLVLILAIIIIMLFSSYFYRAYSRENNDQRYRELLARKDKEINEVQVQQPIDKNSQVDNS